MRPAGTALMSLALASAAQAEDYRVSAKDSVVYVVVKKDSSTLLAGAAHDHVIRAVGLSGTIHYDAAKPEQCRVSIAVPVAELRADEPAMRKRAGLSGELGESDRRSVEEHMRAADQLDAAAHPLIRFEARSCTLGQEGLRVRGELSIRGKAKQIELPMKLALAGETLSARGEIGLRHADFGMEPYSAGLGAIKNGELLRFVLEVQATLTPAAPAGPGG